MDVEVAHRAEGKSRLERSLAVLVGLTAVAAALLSAAAVDASRREQAAQALASRLTVQISEGTTATGILQSFSANATLESLRLDTEAVARLLEAAPRSDVRLAESAVAVADSQASPRLLRVAGDMTRPPSASSGVDPVTRSVLALTAKDLSTLVVQENVQVDLANRFGRRGNLVVFALTLVAIAAVLLGLAGILKTGSPGRIALAVATLVLLAAVGWGVAALLV